MLTFAIDNAKLRSVSIELHLMGPAFSGRWSFHELAQLRLDEGGKGLQGGVLSAVPQFS
jgi:hypothetical protein